MINRVNVILAMISLSTQVLFTKYFVNEIKARSIFQEVFVMMMKLLLLVTLKCSTQFDKRS